MHPSVKVMDINFSPYMIGPVVDFSGFVPKRNTQACKSICVLSTPSSSCLKELLRMVIAWKPGHNHTSFAPIAFNTCSMPFSIFCRWCLITKTFHIFIARAFSALWFITPAEKIFFEPLEKSLDLNNLICLTKNILWNT